MDRRAALTAKTVAMTTEPVERLVFRLALPSIATMVISALYNMADTYFVGRLGTPATAAVGVSFSLMAMIQAVGFLCGQGAGNLVSRRLGSGMFEDAARIATTGFFASFFVGCLICAAGHVDLDFMARILGSTPTILPHAKDYLFYVLLGTPFIASSFTLNNLLRYQGSAFYGMIGMLTGAVVNIALDPVFIFTLDMGVAGAALATMLSQILSLGLLLAGTFRSGNIPIRLRNLNVRAADCRGIFVTGLPSLCRQGIAAVATVCLNRVAGQFGDAAIAAMSIVQRVSMFSIAMMLGWGQGFQPVCGFNYGAKHYDRVKKAFWFCVKISTGFLTVMCGIAMIFAPEIVAVFRADDPDVIRLGSFAMRCQAAMFPTMGWFVMNNMMLQSVGSSYRASLLAVARQGLILMPMLFFLTAKLGVLGVQIAQPVSDVATVALSLYLGLDVLRKMPDVSMASAQNGSVEDIPEPAEEL